MPYWPDIARCWGARALSGVGTDTLASVTLKCRRLPRLFCIGEVVDVTGHFGGFDFHWASARVAGAFAEGRGASPGQPTYRGLLLPRLPAR